jgi:hypothetical protein
MHTTGERVLTWYDVLLCPKKCAHTGLLDVRVTLSEAVRKSEGNNRQTSVVIRRSLVFPLRDDILDPLKRELALLAVDVTNTAIPSRRL